MKTIEMRQVSFVSFHYDKDAPVKSKKLTSKKDLDPSRFDVYTSKRIYNFKGSPNDVDDCLKDSVEWVAALQQALEFY